MNAEGETMKGYTVGSLIRLDRCDVGEQIVLIGTAPVIFLKLIQSALPDLNVIEPRAHL
jgi:hypothetical protein